MGSTCSVHTAYVVRLVDIFVKGTAWVEPLAPGGGRGLKMCHMFTHVINCTVCYSISSSSMEINVPLGTNCLGFSDVARSPPKLFIPIVESTVNLSGQVEQSKFCVRGEGASVSGRVLVKRTGLTLHEPITSARRLSFLQSCHHYCVFSADKSVRSRSGDLSRMCVTLIFQQAVSINTFNQKHT